MTRTDTFVVGTLLVLLAIIAGLIGVPALQPTTGLPSPSVATVPRPVEPPRPYREGAMVAHRFRPSGPRRGASVAARAAGQRWLQRASGQAAAGAKTKDTSEKSTNRTSRTMVNCHSRRSTPRRLR